MKLGGGFAMLSEARPSVVASVRPLVAELAGVVGALDPAAVAALSGGEAAALTGLFARMERLAAAGKTLCSGRVAETGQYRAEGFSSAPRWLADLTKSSFGEATRTVATAAHLGDDELAATRAAFVDGSLTDVQADEIASTAAAVSGEQERLLTLAGRETTKRLRDECRKVRLAGRPAGRPNPRRLAEEMRLSMRDLGDGMSNLFARMPTACAVQVMAAIRAQADAVFARARAERRDDPHQAYLVEALVTLLLLGPLGPPGPGAGDDADADAGTAPVSDDAGRRTGDPTSAGDDGNHCEDDPCLFDDPDDQAVRAMLRGEPPPVLPSRQHRRRRRRQRAVGLARAKILVRVDQSALLRGFAEGDETCDIAGVGPVSVATVRELWPDAVVKLVLTRGDDVVNVTHLGRRATEAMTTAMQWRPAVCSNTACDNDRFLEVDHRLGWANVHRTRVDELDGLCSECHGHKTTDNWQLVRSAGRRRFVPPEHPDHPGDPPTPVRRRE